MRLMVSRSTPVEALHRIPSTSARISSALPSIHHTQLGSKLVEISDEFRDLSLPFGARASSWFRSGPPWQLP